MKKLIFLISCFFMYIGYAQQTTFKPSVWKLTNLSGNLRLSGAYSIGENLNSETIGQVKTSSVFGGFSLFTKSYVYHPNLLSLDISGGYEPRVIKFQDLVNPDYSQSNTTKFLNLKTTVLKKTKHSLFGYFLNNETYANRENYSSAKSNNRTFGGSLNLSYTFLPLTISYTNTENTIAEIEIDRKVIRKEVRLEGNMSKNYGESNKNKYQVRLFNVDFFNGITSNIINTNNNISISDAFISNLYNYKGYVLNSRINFNQNRSSFNNRNLFSFNNFLKPQTFKNLDWLISHNYQKFKFGSSENTSNMLNGNVSHRLYESLFSNISVNYNYQDLTTSTQSNTNIQFRTNYKKKIPLNGQLNIGVSLRLQNIMRNGTSKEIKVFDEAYQISDNDLILIENNGVDLSSLVVKDETRSFIFQQNIDYIVVNIGNFVEIQRIVGGLIPNNSTIYIDYIYLQDSNYKINGDQLSYNFGVSLFHEKVNINYRNSRNNYKNKIEANNLSLDIFKRDFYSFNTQLGLFSGGISFDNYNSNIVPYKLLNYNLNIHGVLKKVINYRIGYNSIKYLSIGFNDMQQENNFINATISYRISNKSTLKLNLFERQQFTDQYNLEWTTGRLNFTTKWNQILFDFSANAYERKETNRNSKFLGMQIRLIRNF